MAEDVDVLAVCDDGALFLEKGGGAVGHCFLDCELAEDFGLLDMDGLRAADRALRIPPPTVVGGPLLLMTPPFQEAQDEETPERSRACS